MNVQMPDVERQMGGKWSSKRCWAHFMKNRNDKKQSKNAEKGTNKKIENQRKMNERKRDEWRDNEKWSFVMIKMILGLITLKHSLALLILSFKTMNPGLHYVTKKFILIKHGYLD